MPTVKNNKNFVMQRDKQISNSLKQQNRDRVYKSNIWQSLRKKKLMDQPLCEVHQMAGKLELATDVHHKVSFVDKTGNEMLRVAYDYGNLCSICKSCHGKIHAGMTMQEVVDELKNQ